MDGNGDRKGMGMGMQARTQDRTLTIAVDSHQAAMQPGQLKGMVYRGNVGPSSALRKPPAGWCRFNNPQSALKAPGTHTRTQFHTRTREERERLPDPVALLLESEIGRCLPPYALLPPIHQQRPTRSQQSNTHSNTCIFVALCNVKAARTSLLSTVAAELSSLLLY
jgi:hypothetical protein